MCLCDNCLLSISSTRWKVKSYTGAGILALSRRSANVCLLKWVQLTFEQHRFELSGSTYTRIFFSSKYCCTIHGWLNLRIQNSGFGGPTVNCTRICKCEEGGYPWSLSCSRVNCYLKLDQSTWEICCRTVCAFTLL